MEHAVSKNTEDGLGQLLSNKKLQKRSLHKKIQQANEKIKNTLDNPRLNQAIATDKSPIISLQIKARRFKLMALNGDLSKSGPLLKRRLASKQSVHSHNNSVQQNIKLEESEIQVLEESMKLLTKWTNAEMESGIQVLLQELSQAIAYGEKSINHVLLNEAKQEPFHFESKQLPTLANRMENLPSPNRKAAEVTLEQLSNIDPKVIKGSLRIKLATALFEQNLVYLNQISSKSYVKHSSFSHEPRA